MGRLRVAVKLVALAVHSSAAYLFLVGTNTLVRLADRVRGTRAAPQWRASVFQAWCRQIGRILGMKADLRGTPPRPPFLLVANHLSYVDVILLAGHLRCVFVAKSEVAGWPAIGALCRSVDTLFIDRELKRDIPRVTEQIDRILGQNRGVVIFPEGTSTDGAGVQRFKPALLAGVARSGVPVSYASLSYNTPPGSIPARLSVCWWGDMVFGAHVLKLLELKEFSASIVFGEEPIRETDRKRLASRLQDAVESQFEPVV